MPALEVTPISCTHPLATKEEG